jgi:hypothetical protein
VAAVSTLLLAARAYEAMAKGKSRAEREQIAADVMAILLSSEKRGRGR